MPITRDLDQPDRPLAERSWQADAACRGADPIDFDIPEGTPVSRELCQSCPVVEECLGYLLAWPTQAGYGAGLTETERTALRRKTGPNARHPWRKQR